MNYIIDILSSGYYPAVWSNVIMSGAFAFYTILLLKKDFKNKKTGLSSVCFLIFTAISLTAIVSHLNSNAGPMYPELQVDLISANYAAVGFGALVLELFSVNRLKVAQNNGIWESPPFNIIYFIIVTAFILTQAFNWLFREQPLFIFAILDYFISLLVMLTLSLIVIYKSRKSDKKLVLKYEKYNLLFIFFVVVGSLFQQLVPIMIQGIFYGSKPWIGFVSPNDIYHILCVIGMYFMYLASNNINKI